MISLSSLRGYREVQARRAGSWYCCKCSLSAVNLHDFWCHNLCVCVSPPQGLEVSSGERVNACTQHCFCLFFPTSLCGVLVFDSVSRLHLRLLVFLRRARSLSHTIFATPSFTTQLCTPVSHTTSSHAIFHHTIFHTQLCTPLSHTTSSHAIFHHTIFHTQLCTHTHHFVTHNLPPHHLSHTTLSHTIFHHTIFHTQLCAYLLRNFLSNY